MSSLSCSLDKEFLCLSTTPSSGSSRIEIRFLLLFGLNILFLLRFVRGLSTTTSCLYLFWLLSCLYTRSLLKFQSTTYYSSVFLLLVKAACLSTFSVVSVFSPILSKSKCSSCLSFLVFLTLVRMSGLLTLWLNFRRESAGMPQLTCESL